jgi:preprotein translocase subunit SecG
MSPHCPAIFLQQARSAGVMAAFGTAQAMTGNATNNTAKARTPTLRMSVNGLIVAAIVN